MMMMMTEVVDLISKCSLLFRSSPSSIEEVVARNHGEAKRSDSAREWTLLITNNNTSNHKFK
jgi:hypothetical protein